MTRDNRPIVLGQRHAQAERLADVVGQSARRLFDLLVHSLQIVKLRYMSDSLYRHIHISVLAPVAGS